MTTRQNSPLAARAPRFPGTIETARLILRPLELSDAPWVGRESGRPEVARNLALVPSPNPALFAELFILTVRTKPVDCVRLVTERATSEPLGVIGAHHKRDGAYGFGYWYAPTAWGRGIATEAGRAMIETVAASGATRLESGYFTHNPASGRVLEKLGFTYTGDDSPQFCTAVLARQDHRCMARWV